MKKKRLGKRLGAFLAAFVLTISMFGSVTYADSNSDVADAANGVARLFVVLTQSGYIETQYSDGSVAYDATTITVGFATGSAFGIGKVGEETDTFVTNRHVVTDDEYEVAEIWLLLDSNAVEYSYDYSYYYDAEGNEYNSASLSYDIDETKAIRCDIEYLGDDEYPDIAIVKARETVTGRTALALYSSDNVSVTDEAWAIGYPGDSDDVSEQTTTTGVKYSLAADVSDVTVTDGTISRITTMAAYDNTTVIQHTASISHGNSGGPLVNENGAVIGINTYTYAGDESDFYSVVIDYIIDVCDANGIEYELYTEESTGIPIVPIVIAVIVIIAVVVVIVAIGKKKKKPEAQSTPQSAPEPFVQEPQPAPAPAPQPAAYAGASAGNSIPGDSGYRVQCTAGALAGRRFAIVNQLRIGRDPNKNDVVFPADTKGISGVHCVVGVTNGQITLMDLGSTYGTYLAQGQRIAANQPVALQVGDTFTLGSKDQAFVITRKGGI